MIHAHVGIDCTSVSACPITVGYTAVVAGDVISMATVTQAGEAGDAALIVKGDGRVHGRTPVADWRKVDGVFVTIGNLDAICTAPSK